MYPKITVGSTKFLMKSISENGKISEYKLIVGRRHNGEYIQGQDVITAAMCRAHNYFLFRRAACRMKKNLQSIHCIYLRYIG